MAGLATVTTPLVAFVDSDVVLPDGWLDELLPHFDDPRVGLVAPRIRSTPGTSVLERYEAQRSPLDLGPEPARIRAGTRVSYVPAAAIVVRVDAIREVGGFDPDDPIRRGRRPRLATRRGRLVVPVRAGRRGPPPAAADVAGVGTTSGSTTDRRRLRLRSGTPVVSRRCG